MIPSQHSILDPEFYRTDFDKIPPVLQRNGTPSNQEAYSLLSTLFRDKHRGLTIVELASETYTKSRVIEAWCDELAGLQIVRFLPGEPLRVQYWTSTANMTFQAGLENALNDKLHSVFNVSCQRQIDQEDLEREQTRYTANLNTAWTEAELPDRAYFISSRFGREVDPERYRSDSWSQAVRELHPVKSDKLAIFFDQRMVEDRQASRGVSFVRHSLITVDIPTFVVKFPQQVNRVIDRFHDQSIVLLIGISGDGANNLKPPYHSDLRAIVKQLRAENIPWTIDEDSYGLAPLRELMPPSELRTVPLNNPEFALTLIHRSLATTSEPNPHL